LTPWIRAHRPPNIDAFNDRELQNGAIRKIGTCEFGSETAQEFDSDQDHRLRIYPRCWIRQREERKRPGLAGLAPALPWLTATQYYTGGAVISGTALYRAVVDHVSGVFATDLSNGKWLYVADVKGADGADGADGANGSNGAPGVGVPTGGSTGQMLTKTWGTNYDTSWTTPASGIAISPQGRATLSSGVPAPTSDLTAQTSIYFTPTGGNRVPIYDGTNFISTTFSELTLAFDSASGHTGYHQSGKNFDLFVINDGGTIRFGTGPAWASDKVRGSGAGTTELEFYLGFAVNKNTITIRFGSGAGDTVSVPARRATLVGSFRATADGQATDSAAKRLLSNAYNVLPRPMLAVDTSDSWSYSTATFRQANNSTANQAAYLHCLDGLVVSAHVIAGVANSTSTQRAVQVGIGLSSSTVDSSTRRQYLLAGNTSGVLYNPWASYKGCPGIGYNELRWLEKGGGSDTQTWYGDAGVPAQLQFGLEAETLN
jgi:hypothetical protein